MWLHGGPSAALDVVAATRTPLQRLCSLPGSTKRRLPARPAYSDSITVRHRTARTGHELAHSPSPFCFSLYACSIVVCLNFHCISPTTIYESVGLISKRGRLGLVFVFSLYFFSSLSAAGPSPLPGHRLSGSLQANSTKPRAH
jgi:hypothetical protein